MGIIIQSIIFYNQLRNGVNFDQNLGDFTTELKANVGDKVKGIATIVINNGQIGIGLQEPAGSVVVSTGTIGGDYDLKLNSNQTSVTSWEDYGFRVGDPMEVYDDSGMSVVADGVIISIQNEIARISGSGTNGTYNEGEIRNKAPITDLSYSYDLSTRINQGNTATSDQYLKQDWFGIPNLSYQWNGVGLPDPVMRSTDFVDGVTKGGLNWDSGSSRVRFVENQDGNEWQQKFELEHIFIVQRIDDQTYLQGTNGNFLTGLAPSNPFIWGTLDYNAELFRNNVGLGGQEPVFLGQNTIVGDVGWFNEPFDSGASGEPNDYTLISTDYQDITFGVPATRVVYTSTTRVTHVIEGINFVAGQPVMVHQTRRPSKSLRQNDNETYESIWVNDALRTTIGAASVNSTIIQNLIVNLDSPTQITVQYDLVYSGNEGVQDGENVLLYLSMEDNTGTYDADNTNRVNLIGGSTTYLVSTDEPDLFFVDSYEIYNHLEDLDVDTPNTDFEGWIEDGLVIDMVFRIKLIDNQNKRNKLTEFDMCMVAYSDVESKYFYIWRQEFFIYNDGGQDGSVRYLDQWSNRWGSYDFFLADDDQFNKGHADSPTVDIRYISNDGTYATYRATIGIKVNWQESIKVEENLATGRTWDVMSRFFNSGGQNTSTSNDVRPQDVGFVDVSQLNNGLNRKTSNYKNLQWFPRPLIAVRHTGEQSNLIDTNFYTFMPEWKVYDYDTNSDYNGLIETFTTDDNPLTGRLIRGEDNKIIVTFDDGDIKTDVANFEAVIRLEVKNQSGYAIHELSTLRDTYPTNIMKGFGAADPLAEKSIVAGKYVVTCLLDGTRLTDNNYKITGRIFDREAPYDPIADVNLTGWYDASGLLLNTNNTYGIVSALGEVSIWKNLKADSNFDLFQPIIARQPIFDNINQYVQFTPPQDFMYWLDQQLGSEFSVFCVVEYENFGNIQNVITFNDGLNDTFNTNEVQMYEESPPINPQGGIQRSYEGGLLKEIIESPVIRGAGKAIRQHTFDFGNNWKMEINNMVHTTPDPVQNSPVIPAQTTFTVGGFTRRNNNPNVIPVDIRKAKFHEILVFANQDVSGKEEGIYQYLANKWGI